jgi:hypothetical protein
LCFVSPWRDEVLKINQAVCIYIYIYIYICVFMPVTVAERSKACTVFARYEAGIVGSNPTQGMNG